MVEFERGEDLFRQAAEPKHFWKIADGTHTNVFLKLERQKTFVEILEKALQQSK